MSVELKKADKETVFALGVRAVGSLYTQVPVLTHLARSIDVNGFIPMNQTGGLKFLSMSNLIQSHMIHFNSTV